MKIVSENSGIGILINDRKYLLFLWEKTKIQESHNDSTN